MYIYTSLPLPKPLILWPQHCQVWLVAAFLGIVYLILQSFIPFIIAMNSRLSACGVCILLLCYGTCYLTLADWEPNVWIDAIEKHWVRGDIKLLSMELICDDDSFMMMIHSQASLQLMWQLYYKHVQTSPKCKRTYYSIHNCSLIVNVLSALGLIHFANCSNICVG